MIANTNSTTSLLFIGILAFITSAVVLGSCLLGDDPRRTDNDAAAGSFVVALCSGLGVLLLLGCWMGGLHIVWPPTEDQLYGCTVERQAPNGECK